MEADDVQKKLEWALDAFREEDLYLLQHNLAERCIAARLAYHLQVEFEDDELVVDVDYNRDGNVIKRLQLPVECQRLEEPSEEPVMVAPDIIVHKRGGDGPNVLVVELKKSTNAEGHHCDRIRIDAFMAQIGYDFGAIVSCETRPGHDHSIAVIDWMANAAGRA